MFLPTSPRPPSGTIRRTLSDMPASVTAVLFRPTRRRRLPRAGDSTGRRASGTPDSPFRGLFADRRSRENMAMRSCLRPRCRLVPAVLALVAALVVAAPPGAGTDQRHPVARAARARPPGGGGAPPGAPGRPRPKGGGDAPGAEAGAPVGPLPKEAARAGAEAAAPLGGPPRAGRGAGAARAGTSARTRRADRD